MSRLPASVQRWMAILMPPFFLLIALFVMVPRHKKLRQLERDIKVTDVQIQDYLTKLRAISDLPRDPHVATLPMTKQEQSDFLRDLTQMCSQTGNRLITVSSLAAAPPPPSPPPGAPGAVASPTTLPQDVVEIKSNFVFEGSYESLRAFLAAVHESQRLISLTDCRIGPGGDGFPTIQTSLTISRYVDTPPAPPAAAPPQTGASAPAKTI